MTVRVHLCGAIECAGLREPCKAARVYIAAVCVAFNPVQTGELSVSVPRETRRAMHDDGWRFVWDAKQRTAYPLCPSCAREDKGERWPKVRGVAMACDVAAEVTYRQRRASAWESSNG